MAEENGGSLFLVSGETWRYGCRKSPDWDSDVESWTESEGTASSELCEHNVESLALNVTGQNWSGEKICLFLEGWELVRVPLSCHIALDVLCQEMHEEWQLSCCCLKSPLSRYAEPFSHHGSGCDSMERSVVRELKG